VNPAFDCTKNQLTKPRIDISTAFSGRAPSDSNRVTSLALLAVGVCDSSSRKSFCTSWLPLADDFPIAQDEQFFVNQEAMRLNFKRAPPTGIMRKYKTQNLVYKIFKISNFLKNHQKSKRSDTAHFRWKWHELLLGFRTWFRSATRFACG
jgi:hypothetical protein